MRRATPRVTSSAEKGRRQMTPPFRCVRQKTYSAVRRTKAGVVGMRYRVAEFIDGGISYAHVNEVKLYGVSARYDLPQFSIRICSQAM